MAGWKLVAALFVVSGVGAGILAAVARVYLPTESAARAALVETLDAWRLGRKPVDASTWGDRVAAIRDSSMEAGDVLLRYEIGAAATDGDSVYRFQVVLTFQSRARTELQESRIFQVKFTHGRRWLVYGRTE